MNVKALLVYRLVLTFTAIIALPALPSYAGLESSIERTLGNQVAKEIEAETGLVTDPVINAWIDKIGRRLAEAQNRKDVSYSFKVLDSEDVNAMAVPGGHIYITKGLLRFARSEDEIASVLGHEVGHIAGKHSIEQLKAQVLGSLILSVFKNKKYSTAVGGAKLAGLFAMLKFSRDHEREADVLGVRGSSLSGYDARRMMDFFTRMNEKEPKKVSRLESYFLTHPPFSQRLEVLSKQPEMQETGANFAKAADGLAERKLYEQAREYYRKALVRSPGMPDALAGLEKLPKQKPPPRSGNRKTKNDITIDTARVTSLKDRLTVLEKRQNGLQKQLKGTVSNLSFASNFITEYDYAAIRAFQSAVDAINKTAKIISSISNANTSTHDSLTELLDLTKQLNEYDSRADKIRASFVPLLEQVLSELDKQIPDVEQAIKRTEQACRSIDFAVRQLTSAMMMPKTTEFGAMGLVETQLQLAKKNLNSGLLSSRNIVMNLEAARSRLIQTRINLQVCSAGEDARYAYAERAAQYFGESIDHKQIRTDELGTSLISLYQSGIMRDTADKNSKKAVTTVDYDSINILLNLLSWDIDREQKAAERNRGTH